MRKRIVIVAVGLVVVAGILAVVKASQIRSMISHGKKFVPPPETVTTTAARVESWERSLTAVGTLTAVQGVTVAAELAGKVVAIEFEAGAAVRTGGLLVRQDTSSEQAQLPGAEAQAQLARTVLARDEKMLEKQIISRADYDAASANVDQTAAQVNDIRAAIGKKTIRAPFSGRLGIRQVNLGQLLREGDPVVTLQTLDPIHVDFAVPQQDVPRLASGLPVRVTSDAVPGLAIDGRITAVNPLVDPDTRNIRVQATISNREERLRPGMFVNVAVRLPAGEKVIAVPATAVLYAPYGDSVFLVDDNGRGGKTLRQQFVRLGEKRGDFVAVVHGLKEGDVVVSTGVFKLRNGEPAVVDNRLAPPFRAAPAPENG